MFKLREVWFSEAKDCHAPKNKKAQEDETLSALMEKAYLVEKESNKHSMDYYILDSGATTHAVSNNFLLHHYHSEPNATVLLAGKGTSLKALGQGNPKGRYEGRDIVLKDVLHVPKLHKNIISISKLCADGYEVVFANNYCYISYQGQQMMKVEKKNNLYSIRINHHEQVIERVNAITVKQHYDLNTWHKRLGHINYQAIRKLNSTEAVDGFKLIESSKDDPICESCVKCKLTRKPFTKSKHQDLEILDLIHSDIDEMNVKTPDDLKYVLTFIDDRSRFAAIYLMETRAEVFKHFKHFVTTVENQRSKSIKKLRSDNGSEYLSNDFKDFCKKRGILQETTPTYTPELNGVAERFNKSLVEGNKCLLREAYLPDEYWGHAAIHFVYIRNRCLTRGTSTIKTPYEIFTGNKP